MFVVSFFFLSLLFQAKAEAEKAYAKTLKKLPKAVVKFHKDRRIKPMYSPLLRKTEQMFLACALFDIIGILNYIQRGKEVLWLVVIFASF